MTPSKISSEKIKLINRFQENVLLTFCMYNLSNRVFQ
jgi:hypothetical protein